MNRAELVRWYRIKAEHAEAFIAAYILPVREPSAGLNSEGPEGSAVAEGVIRCPTPS